MPILSNQRSRILGSGTRPWWLLGGLSNANAIGIYKPIGAASLAASYINLANPGTNNAAPGTAPTFAAATGWAFNGSAYLTTGIVPASGWTLIVRFSNAPTASDSMLAGSNNGGATDRRFYLCNRLGGDNVTYGAGGFTNASPALAAGVLAIAGQQAYRNGAADGAAIGAWGGTTTYDIWIGGLNLTGTINRVTTGKIQAVAIYNTALTAAQVAAISSAMALL